MNVTNLFKIALRALANNKLRAFLTMLGIIIGVASVITMLAIGQGSKKSIQAQISEMGSNMISHQPQRIFFGTTHLREQQLPVVCYRRKHRLPRYTPA